VAVWGSQQVLHLRSVWIQRRSQKNSEGHRGDLGGLVGGVSGSQECKVCATVGLLGKVEIQGSSRTWYLAGVGAEVGAMGAKGGRAVVVH